MEEKMRTHDCKWRRHDLTPIPLWAGEKCRLGVNWMTQHSNSSSSRGGSQIYKCKLALKNIIITTLGKVLAPGRAWLNLSGWDKERYRRRETPRIGHWKWNRHIQGYWRSRREVSREHGMVSTLYLVQLSLQEEIKSWVSASGWRTEGQTCESSTWSPSCPHCPDLAFSTFQF